MRLLAPLYTLLLVVFTFAAHAWSFGSRMQTYVERLGYYSGLGYQCTYVDYPSKSVRETLSKQLKAQERALESVADAIEAWEFSHTSTKDRTPLVMAVTGPTGTGKTELSYVLAESLFKRRRKLPNSEKQVASGLLIFRGEDFGDNYTYPISEYHTQIKTRMAEHLHTCGGKAVIVFDEVQKVIPNTLDVLMEAVGPRAQLTYYKNGVTKRMDTSNVIFILVSDIGVSEMEKVMVQYETRQEVPSSALEKVVKTALDAQWKRLHFGKVIDKVVPFLPFEQQHISDIIGLKLRQLDENYGGIYWHRLWVQDGIADYMSRLDSVHYEVRSARVGGLVKSTKVFAKYGARNVETGPIQLLKSKLLRYLRPFDPEAEVRISQDPRTSEIVITSCATQAKEADREQDVGFVGLACAVKWQGKFE